MHYAHIHAHTYTIKAIIINKKNLGNIFMDLDKAANIHLEAGSERVCRLKQTCTPTGATRKYLTTITNVFLLIYVVSLDEARNETQKHT